MDVQPQTESPSAMPQPPPAVALAGGSPEPKTPRAVRPFSWLLFGGTLAGNFLAGLLVVALTPVLSVNLKLSPERSLVISATLALLVALGAGLLTAAKARKVGFWETLLSALIAGAGGTFALAQLLMQPFGSARLAMGDLFYLANLLGNPIGGIVLGAVVIGFTSFLGATLGYLLAGSGKVEASFEFELYVARRHLRLQNTRSVLIRFLRVTLFLPLLPLIRLIEKKRALEYGLGATKRSPTMLMTAISMGGVAVGVLALTVVLSVMSGFEADLKNKIIGTNAHAVVLKYGTEFKEWPEIAQKVREVRGVTGVTPFILNEVMISSDQNIGGALVKGIDPETVAQVANLPANMKEGRLDWLTHPESIPRVMPGAGEGGALDGTLHGAAPAGSASKDPAAPTEDDILKPKGAAPADPNANMPGVVLGKELAHSLKVMVGDRVNVVSPLGGELGPTGPMPKSRPFKVAGIFFSGMYEYDAKFAYIAIPEAQKFFGLGESVTGLELKTDDIDNTRQITKSILNAVDGYPYRTKDWGEMNKNLFSALRLEKLVMAVILAFIVLVACFNIVSTLIMMVLEKSKEIAILKSMGATDTSVMKIFVLEGLIIGLIGTVVGLILGYWACKFVEVVGIRLDAEVYYIDKLPVRIDGLQFAAVAFLAVLLSYLATIYPATRASRLPPVEGLRNE